jgi:hypothetical protein
VLDIRRPEAIGLPTPVFGLRVALPCGPDVLALQQLHRLHARRASLATLATSRSRPCDCSIRRLATKGESSLWLGCILSPIANLARFPDLVPLVSLVRTFLQGDSKAIHRSAPLMREPLMLERRATGAYLAYRSLLCLFAPGPTRERPHGQGFGELSATSHGYQRFPLSLLFSPEKRTILRRRN